MQCSSIRYNIMSLLGAYLITLLSPRDGNVDEGKEEVRVIAPYREQARTRAMGNRHPNGVMHTETSSIWGHRCVRACVCLLQACVVSPMSDGAT